MAAIGEGGGAVAVLSRGLELRERVHTEVDGGAGGLVLLNSALREGSEVLGHGVSEVGRHHRGGRLHAAEAEVVAGGGDRHAHEIAELIDARHGGGHDDGEDLVVAGARRELPGVEEVHAVRGADGPVVVLAAAVDAVERLLLQERSEAVLGRHLLHDLHDNEVLIHLLDDGAELGRELVLVGRDLAVAGDKRDAELEALLLDLAHGGHGGHLAVDGGHVVVAALLPTGGFLPITVRPVSCRSVREKYSSRGTRKSSCSSPMLHTSESISQFMCLKRRLPSRDSACTARWRGVRSSSA
mmetsp:Transcript_16003/g.50297  ORF Transcript_16003/g.50297 Transcript_16003/m.50297 type:complete len:298 (+) Transcript_16003:764-1657(+)